MLKKHGRLYVIIVILMIAFLLQYIKMMDVTVKVQGVEAQIAQLQHENKQLTITLARYTSLENIDALAVTKLGMQRPDSVEYILVAQQAKKGKKH